jgi:hypothetical protein
MDNTEVSSKGVGVNRRYHIACNLLLLFESNGVV